MTAVAFVVFTVNIGFIASLIYFWTTRNKPVLTEKEKVEKDRMKRASRTPEENRKREKRSDRLLTLAIDPSMWVVYLVLFPTLLVVYILNFA